MPIDGVLPMAICAYKKGIKNLIIPVENADEAAVLSELNVFSAPNLLDVVKHLNGEQLLERHVVNLDSLFDHIQKHDVDFSGFVLWDA